MPSTPSELKRIQNLKEHYVSWKERNITNHKVVLVCNAAIKSYDERIQELGGKD